LTEGGTFLGSKKTTGGKQRPRIKTSHAAGGPPGGGGGRPVPEHLAPRRATAGGSGGPKTRKTAKASADQTSVASDESRELAIAIAVAALEKKAVGLEILDVAGKVDYADFLVLMTGRSDRQVVALAQGIEETLRKKNRRPLSVEGLPHASWVLMDYGDVVVHVFQDEARGLYDLEGLWMDARRIPVPAPDQMRD
jgi:ribosome-associated protein